MALYPQASARRCCTERRLGARSRVRVERGVGCEKKQIGFVSGSALRAWRKVLAL
jgi:hypothetical protein